MSMEPVLPPTGYEPVAVVCLAWRKPDDPDVAVLPNGTALMPRTDPSASVWWEIVTPEEAAGTARDSAVAAMVTALREQVKQLRAEAAERDMKAAHERVEHIEQLRVRQRQLTYANEEAERVRGELAAENAKWNELAVQIEPAAATIARIYRMESRWHELVWRPNEWAQYGDGPEFEPVTVLDLVTALTTLIGEIARKPHPALRAATFGPTHLAEAQLVARTELSRHDGTLNSAVEAVVKTLVGALVHEQRRVDREAEQAGASG